MSDIIRNTFDTVCNGYDDKALAFFPRSAAALAGRLELAGDEHVLDVATGTGHLALSIASALPEGDVTAIDFSQGMLGCARQKAMARGIGNIDFLEMDMQGLDFEPDAFDAAACAFGIFFVDDMAAQLKRISSVVKPGGLVAITTFEEDHFFNPLAGLMFERIQKFGIEKPPQTWKHVGTAAGCRELFEQVGLTGIRVEYENVGYHLDSVDDWWSVVWNGGFRRLVGQLSPEDQEKFRTEHMREVEELRTGDGIWLDVGVLFTLGKKV